jgi:uncharacterized protein involved in outer membrane biogenesis
MRPGTVLKLALLGALALVVALVAVVKSIDVNKYRDVAAQLGKSLTGRDLTIRGKLSLKISLNPALIAEDVVLANAPWASGPEMVRIQRLQVEIGLLPLLVHEVRVRRLVLVEPDIVLERDAFGRVNWDFVPHAASAQLPAPDAAGTPTTFKIGQVRVENGRLVYRDAKTGRQETVVIEQMTAEADSPAAPIGVGIGGFWNGRRFDVNGVLGPLGDLTSAGKPYPIKVNAVLAGVVATLSGTLSGDKTSDPQLALSATVEANEIGQFARLAGVDLPSLGAARLTLSVAGTASAPSLPVIDAVVGRRDAVALTVRGKAKAPLTAKGVDLVLTLDADNLAAAAKMLGGAATEPVPARITARLADTEGGWRLTEVKAVAGHSDLAGDLTLHTVGRRPSIEIRLASSTLDLGELRGPQPAPGKPRQEASRLFPDDPLPFRLLSAIDADGTWQIDRLADNGLTAERVALSLTLKDGRLVFTPRVGAIAGGELGGTLTVDAAVRTPAVALQFSADKVGLGEALRALHVTGAVHGARTNLRLNLKGTGNSVRAIMGRLNGETAVAIDKGTIDGAYADVLAVDVLRQLAPWTDEKNTEMQCLVSRFAITDGMARSAVLLFDTTHMTVGGQGSINLANESLDFTLSPKPKEASFFSLAMPLDVGGTLAHPSVQPNKGAIVKGLAGVGGIAALGPLAALIPLATSAGAEPNPCLAALGPPAKAAAPPKKSAKKGLRGRAKEILGQ